MVSGTKSKTGGEEALVSHIGCYYKKLLHSSSHVGSNIIALQTHGSPACMIGNSLIMTSRQSSEQEWFTLPSHHHQHSMRISYNSCTQIQSQAVNSLHVLMPVLFSNCMRTLDLWRLQSRHAGDGQGELPFYDPMRSIQRSMTLLVNHYEQVSSENTRTK